MRVFEDTGCSHPSNTRANKNEAQMFIQSKLWPQNKNVFCFVFLAFVYCAKEIDQENLCFNLYLKAHYVQFSTILVTSKHIAKQMNTCVFIINRVLAIVSH